MDVRLKPWKRFHIMNLYKGVFWAVEDMVFEKNCLKIGYYIFGAVLLSFAIWRYHGNGMVGRPCTEGSSAQED